MKITWDLAKMFPTEESRYDACIKMLKAMLYITIIGMAINIYSFWFESKMEPTGFIGSIYWLVNLINTFIVAIWIYSEIYCFFKSKTHVFFLKLLAGIIVSVLLSFILGMVLAGGEPIYSLITLPVVALFGTTAALIINRKRWAYVKANKRYLLLFFIPMILEAIIFAILYFVNVALIRTEPLSVILIRFSSMIWASLVFVVYLIHFMKKEKNKGVPFFKSWQMQITVPVTFFFLIFSWITIILGPLFRNNVFLNNGDFNIDNDTISFNGENIVTDNITGNGISNDININNFANVTDMTPAMEFDGPLFGAGFEPPAVEGIGSFYEPQPLIFGNTSIESTIDIPEIKENPYMLFASDNGPANFVIKDANGMPQLSIQDNTVYNSTNTPIGHIEHNDVTGIRSLTDNTHNTILSMDKQHNIYAGTPETGHLVGRIAKSGAVDTYFNVNGSIGFYKDHLGNFWAEGKPLGHIDKGLQ